MTKDQFSGPVFVVGLWRSGTSLLYSLLNQHPQIALTYESDLFLLRSLFRGRGRRDWLERWEFWNSAPSRHQIDSHALPAQIADYPTAAELVWKQYAGDSLYGDKSPNYYDSMQRMARAFPNARFIVIWRDLFDTCRSIVRASRGSSFFAKRGITHRALIGNRRMKRECDALLRRGIPLHQIQYEEMVDSPETVMRGICWFLQIPFDASMTSLADADVSAIFDAPQHAGVKTGRIGLDEPRAEVLSNELREKIARYIALWKNQSGGVWPAYPRSDSNVSLPGPVERVRDEVLYRGLRAFDRFTAFVYCYAPIGWLRRYRESKAPLPTAKPVEQSASLPQVEEVSTRS
ncbi:MAG: sulfotransferase [Candidatus Sulfotelmatobacter sp.]